MLIDYDARDLRVGLFDEVRRMKFAAEVLTILVLASVVVLTGCGGAGNAASEAPPAAHVVTEQDGTLIHVDHAEQFPLEAAVQREAASKLVVTGAVNPDVSRTVPVVTLASGRVVEVKARLGDTVKKGQPLLRIRSDDVSSGYSDYRKAVADELLARQQLERANDLFAHGAIAESELQAAVDTASDAKTTLETTTEHLRLLGNDPDHPSGLVEIAAPVSGVITDQEVTQGSSVQSFGTNPFTISDLSYVWVVCDVYENDLPSVRMGETADVRLNAYPNQVFKGTISNIGAVLDPSIRTAKVRIEVKNPGLMRVGMFASATFYGLKKEAHAVVPADAILHLHDRDWVFVPAGDDQFRRVEIVAGDTLPNNLQEVLSGLAPGQKVVTKALTLQNAVDNE
jgi:membrane fusion protein, heavy metal efflux system